MSPAARRAIVILVVGLVALGMVLAGVWYFRGGNDEIRSGQVAVGGGGDIGGPFSLLDAGGRRVTEQDFAGRYLLVYFGFTHCVDACPLSLLSMTQALDRLPPAVAAKIQPLFITVDPRRDDAAQIGLYLENFHPSFVGLTGSEPEIAAAAKAYRAVYQTPEPDANGDYQVQHGTVIYLMGPDGRFLQHFPHTVPAGDLAAALQKVVGD